MLPPGAEFKRQFETGRPRPPSVETWQRNLRSLRSLHSMGRRLMRTPHQSELAPSDALRSPLEVDHCRPRANFFAISIEIRAQTDYYAFCASLWRIQLRDFGEKLCFRPFAWRICQTDSNMVACVLGV